MYPGVDHLDIYDGPEHEAVVADQLAFLDRTSSAEAPFRRAGRTIGSPPCHSRTRT
jgi:hypothetical protein